MHHQTQSRSKGPFSCMSRSNCPFQIEFQLQKVQYLSRSFQHPSFFLHVSTRKNSKTRPRLIVNRKNSKELAAKMEKVFPIKSGSCDGPLRINFKLVLAQHYPCTGYVPCLVITGGWALLMLGTGGCFKKAT